MATLRFTNVVNCNDGAKFETIDDAISVGKKAGFEFTVWKGGSMVASWTVFGGLAIKAWVRKAGLTTF